MVREELLLRSEAMAAANGVTRVANITGLDRLGIPVHSAIVPKSGDFVSVYSGRGLTPINSRIGALLEAVERQIALSAKLPIIEECYRKIRAGKVAVVNPRAFTHKLQDDYSEGRPYWWVEGYDLISKEAVLVPAGLACYGPHYLGSRSPYEVNSSNGLALGTCFEEALCHGLCELLERDAWTLADLRSQWIPHARYAAAFGTKVAELGCDDPNAHPRIDLSEAGEPITELIGKFNRAGLHPVVRDVTSDFGIPCVIASVADDSIVNFPQAHSGIGAHPNARIAVIRALTELAQSRAVDIQGVREDLEYAGVPVHPANAKTQRVEKIDSHRWMLQQQGTLRPFGEIASAKNDSAAEDVALILSRLSTNGMETAIVVDLSEPGPFRVIRVLVPGLEFWSVDRGRLGERALEFWRRHV